jgi:hypothetical protein
MKKYRMQLIFGLPILAFAMAMIALDAAGTINIEKLGYAFFGSIISLLLNYYFRKSPPKEEQR